MYLPIAVLYNTAGIATVVRYYVFDEEIGGNYNSYNESYLPTSTCQQGRVVEVPIENLTALCKIDVVDYARFSSHRYIRLGEKIGITKVGSDGTIIRDYTQLIVPKNVKSCTDDTLYAVDYKGNVVALPYKQILKLRASRRLTIGNPAALDIIYQLFTDSINFGKNYSDLPQECLLSPYEERLNTHKTHLNSLYARLNLDNASQATSDVFTAKSISYVEERLTIPEGAAMIDVDTEGRVSDFNTIVCPSRVSKMHYTSENDDIKHFVCPEMIMSGFRLDCQSIDNLVLPKWVLGLDGSRTSDEFELFLRLCSNENISFSSGTPMSEICIDNAPNLKTVNIGLLPYKLVSGDTPLEISTFITLADAPKLQAIKISPQKSDFGDRLQRLHYLDLNIAAMDYTITCELPVDELKLRIPSTKGTAITITIEHCGIDSFSCISFTKNVRLIFKGGKPKRSNLDGKRASAFSRYFLPAQVDYI